MSDNLQVIINALRQIQTEGGDGNFVILECPGGNRYIQFSGERGSSGLEAEAVSNEYLEPDFALDPDQEFRLQAMGWTPPAHGSKDNFCREWQANTDGERRAIAREVMQAFRQVYGLRSDELIRVELVLE